MFFYCLRILKFSHLIKNKQKTRVDKAVDIYNKLINSRLKPQKGNKKKIRSFKKPAYNYRST